MIIEARGICKSYFEGDMEVPVLKNVDFAMKKGEYTAIMGPSGSGKSTLMNIIGCLDQATAGTLILDGEDVSGLSEDELSAIRAGKVGFVFQTFQLLPYMTALENVALPMSYAGVPRSERPAAAAAMLGKVGLEDRMNFLPNQLSGGQKQRVAIARAMINRPVILLADEPTGALDSKSGRQVMEIFSQLNAEGTSILMITHDPAIAAYADRVVTISDGELSEEGRDRGGPWKVLRSETREGRI